MSQDASGVADSGAGAGGDWPKASIGNYKGVMLCNRPNEFGQQRRPERTGQEPFKSRVDPKEPIGWNPAMKLLPRTSKKKRDPNSILVRHRKFLKELEKQKMLEREQEMIVYEEKENAVNKFKQQAKKQRDRIQGLKEAEIDKQNNVLAGDLEESIQAIQARHAAESGALQEIPQDLQSKPEALTAANLTKHEKSVKALSVAASSKKGGKSSKPAWAVTDKMREDEKEQEIDDLLEFAYELDYEKYMEDYEVRQALAIIKDRVNEIAKDDDWKEKMADDWNKAREMEAAEKKHRQPLASDAQSQISYQSKASNASYMSRMSQAKKQAAESKQDWDQSVTSEKKKISAEDRMASKIANEVLRDNAKLRAVHSGNSIKHLLEREAKRQMQLIDADGGDYKGPVVSRIVERQKKDGADPSNLPYLHKNPAI